MLPIRPAAALLAVLSGAGLLVACGGGSTPSNCTAPTGSVALVYPAPSSTGIPDNFPGVIFGSSNGLPSTYVALVQRSDGQLQIPLMRVAPAPSPLPSPNLIPSFANPVYQLSSSAQILSKLSGGSKYLVLLNDTNSPCRPTVIGSFTLQ